MRRIEQPHVCIWGVTSPDVLYEGLSSAQLRDGWLARIITIISDERPKFIITESLPPPEHLVTQFSAWYMRTISPPPDSGDITAATGCYQQLVPTHPKALRAWDAFAEECIGKIERLEELHDATQYLYGKACELARRIALILACGERFDDAEVSEENALWAIDFMRHSVNNFREVVKRNASDTPWERDRKLMLQMLEREKNRGMSKRDLSRKTYWIKDKRTRDSYLADLEEAGLVTISLHPEKKNVWLWASPFGYETKEENQEEGRL